MGGRLQRWWILHTSCATFTWKSNTCCKWTGPGDSTRDVRSLTVVLTFPILQGLHANASRGPEGIFCSVISPCVSIKVEEREISMSYFFLTLSSAMMSVSSTCRNTPSSSPKSPPNRLLLVHLQSFYLYPPSPNVELADIKEFKEQLKLQGVFINREPEHKGEF